MSANSPLLEEHDLTELVRQTIAEVLVVPIHDVLLDSALIQDLGAESIDFLDLVFRLEETLGRRIPVDRWDRYVREQLAGQQAAVALTTKFVVEFARHESGLG